MDGRKHGSQILGGINVVDADNGNIAGDVKAAFLKSMHGANGSNVIAAEDSGNLCLTFQKQLGSPVAILRRKLYIRHIFPAERDPVLTEGLAVSGISLLKRGLADIANMGMAQMDQMLCNGNGRLFALTDNLIIFGVQAVKAGIDNVVKILL